MFLQFFLQFLVFQKFSVHLQSEIFFNNGKSSKKSNKRGRNRQSVV